MVATDRSVLSRPGTRKTVRHSSKKQSYYRPHNPEQNSYVFDPVAELAQEFNVYKKIDCFYNESHLKEMIAIESKRIYRNKNAFLLVLIDVSSMMAKIGYKNPDGRINGNNELNGLIKVLHQSTRKIDIKGWYVQDSVIGILCLDSEKAHHQIIMDKMRTNLVHAINPKFAADITIRWKSFPCNDPVNDKTRVIRLGEILDDITCSKPAFHAKKTGLVLKRAIDIIGSLTGLVLSAPFLAIIALLVKITSKGPVFFRQQRVGMDGKTFTFLKFRSMYVNNDDSIHKAFIAKLINGEIQAKEGEEKNAYKMKDDPRITKIGKFIRKTSLDELPQFLNVLAGDMSLVGPRPPIPYEVEKYDMWHTRRVLNVKPGITGFWQVEGRSSTSFDAMVRMDLQYIKNWSVWLDIKLLFKTPFAIFMAKGAC